MQTSLTGVKPTGTPHLGNYLGAIRPALQLVEQYRSIYFIADYHALTSERDPKALQSYIYDVAATLIDARNRGATWRRGVRVAYTSEQERQGSSYEVPSR